MSETETELTQEEAEAMLERLSRHYHEPVMPVGRYCEALRTWERVVGERDKWSGPEFQAINSTFLGIQKSNLLARLIYDGESLRTKRCPLHDGRWSGISPCEHGCGSTGWVPDDWPDAAPRCTQHPDRPAVSRTVSVHASTNDCWECYQSRWERRKGDSECAQS